MLHLKKLEACPIKFLSVLLKVFPEISNGHKDEHLVISQSYKLTLLATQSYFGVFSVRMKPEMRKL